MLLQFVLAIAAFVLAARDIALELALTTMLLGMALHVGFAGVILAACGARPARVTIGSGHRARSGGRWSAAHVQSRRGAGGVSTKRNPGCSIVVAAMGHPNGGRVIVVRRVRTGVSVTSRVDSIVALEALAVYRAKSRRRVGAAQNWHVIGELSTKGSAVGGVVIATMVHANGAGVVRRVETGVRVTSLVDAIAVVEMIVAYRTKIERVDGAANARHGAVCGMAVAGMGHIPKCGGILQRIGAGAGVSGWVDTITASKRNGSIIVLIVGYARGS